MTSRKYLLLQIYFYLICLVVAVVVLIVVGNGLWGAVSMAFPRLTMNDRDYKAISSFEHYRANQPKRAEFQQETEQRPVDQTELRRRWEEEKQLLIDTERRSGLREFIRMWVWIIIVVPIYFIHWRAAKKLKDPTPQPATPGS